MAWGDVSLAAVSRDLLSIERSALAALGGYERYLGDAEAAGQPEVAYFVRQLMEEDSARAVHCRGLLEKLGAADGAASASPVPGRQR